MKREPLDGRLVALYWSFNMVRLEGSLYNKIQHQNLANELKLASTLLPIVVKSHYNFIIKIIIYLIISAKYFSFRGENETLFVEKIHFSTNSVPFSHR